MKNLKDNMLNSLFQQKYRCLRSFYIFLMVSCFANRIVRFYQISEDYKIPPDKQMEKEKILTERRLDRVCLLFMCSTAIIQAEVCFEQNRGVCFAVRCEMINSVDLVCIFLHKQTRKLGKRLSLLRIDLWQFTMASRRVCDKNETDYFEIVLKFKSRRTTLW